MANRGRPTQTKRQRERARQDRAKLKGERRADAKLRRQETPPRPTSHDPDIEGMVAGPQAMPQWQRDFFEEEKRAQEAGEAEEAARKED